MLGDKETTTTTTVKEPVQPVEKPAPVKETTTTTVKEPTK